VYSQLQGDYHRS